MALKMRLVSSTPTAIEFEPDKGWSRPDNDMVVKNFATSGKLYISSTGKYLSWEMDVWNISLSNATQLLTWHAAKTSLTLYPDYVGDTSEYYTVKIINDKRPFDVDRWTTTQDKWGGHLSLYQVDS